jgi:hypothetical protein
MGRAGRGRHGLIVVDPDVLQALYMDMEVPMASG